MNNGILLFVLSSTFAAMVLAGQGIYFWARSRRDEEAEKVRHRLGLDQQDEVEEALASLLREQAADGAIATLGRAGEDLQQTIQQAGLEMTVSALLAQMAVLFIVGGVVGYLIQPPLAVIAFAAGYFPYGYVTRTADARAKRLLEQMPDGLEMMGRAMQAGAGLIDGFKLVQDEMNDPIAFEFGRVAEEVRFGKDWREAMEGLIARNPSIFDLRLLVSSLLLQREAGGNMIETVTRISKLIRQRAAFDNKVKAMTSEARASGLILALMPLGVLLMIFLANAPYLEPLVDTTIGQVVIVYAVASYGIGIFVMTAASNVDV